MSRFFVWTSVKQHPSSNSIIGIWKAFWRTSKTIRNQFFTNKEGISKYKKEKARKMVDYAIKARNLQEVKKLELVRQEREKQVRIDDSFIGKEKESISS